MIPQRQWRRSRGGVLVSGISSPADLFSGGQDGFAVGIDSAAAQWQDTSGGTAAAAGDPIGQTDDLSGNGYAITSTGSARPILRDSGGRYAEFNGSRRWTVTGSAASLKWLHGDVGFGIAMLIRIGTSSNPNTFYSILGNYANSSANSGVYLFYDDRASASRNDTLTFRATRGSVGTYVYDNTPTPDGSAPASTDITLTVNAATGGPANIYVDNVLKLSAAKTNPTSTSDAAYDLDIGAGGSNYAPLVGRIYQLIVRDEEFSPAELADIETYFASML